jgi:hypothetical protein
MTVYEVKAILGHSDIRTTMRYAHLEQRQVATKARDLLEGLVVEIKTKINMKKYPPSRESHDKEENK